MAVAATTELEAINIMLAAIAEAPINSLTGTLPVDAVTARSTLAEFNKEGDFNLIFNINAGDLHYFNDLKLDLPTDYNALDFEKIEKTFLKLKGKF